MRVQDRQQKSEARHYTKMNKQPTRERQARGPQAPAAGILRIKRAAQDMLGRSESPPLRHELDRGYRSLRSKGRRSPSPEAHSAADLSPHRSHHSNSLRRRGTTHSADSPRFVETTFRNFNRLEADAALAEARQGSASRSSSPVRGHEGSGRRAIRHDEPAG